MENVVRKTQSNEGNQLSLSEIAGQLLSDVQQLIRQEAELIRTDIANDLNEKRIRYQKVAWGVYTALLGQVAISIALAFFLNEVAGLPYWASFGLVGGGLAAAGYFAAAPKKEEKKEYDNEKYGITRTASGTN